MKRTTMTQYPNVDMEDRERFLPPGWLWEAICWASVDMLDREDSWLGQYAFSVEQL